LFSLVVEVTINKLLFWYVEFGRCYGMEMNVEKTKVMRISRQPSLVQVMIDQNNQRMWNISTIRVA
jgi:hypothetical protein